MSLGTVIPYEKRLEQEAEWAMSEGGKHFDEKSDVHTTLGRIAKRLNDLQVPYAIVGGMALFRHGFRRFTEDVDILVSRQDMKLLHEKLEGRGYLPVFTGSKNLRDTISGVKIEFLLAGDYPGDGLQKPVAFPSPEVVAEVFDEISFASLRSIVELKLASGMTGADRLKDLADVQELIKLLSLERDFSNQLNEYVQGKYTELWDASRETKRRYIRLWRNKFLTLDAKSLEEMSATLREASETLAQMLADGVTLDPNGGTGDDYAHLVTTDPEIAKKYDMHDKSEFLEAE